MSHMLPANQNLPALRTEISDNETILDTTQQILDIAKNVTAPLNQSDTVELVKVSGQTAENIFSILIKSGGKPVAIILATAILIASTALPIFAWGQYQKSVSESMVSRTFPYADANEVECRTDRNPVETIERDTFVTS
jgi:hypothetical protein